ncbi:EcsC family protein [Sphingomonas sp.]|uniref:EcsC family protein n=1 Tax=Sphingomonas sp. TaxID=28214 RepID=UPI001ECC6934|nr:EcsC family protein [Sphingomonas sp.]MBX3593535.1 EcsC family protein [Sphingomonas sp.]
MESVDPGNACAAFGEDDLVELLAIARFHEDADSVLMKLASQAGKQADSVVEWLPDNWEAKLQGMIDLALRQSYAIAFRTNFARARRTPSRAANREGFHRVAAGVVGAAGGMGGITTTLADLAVTTTLILRSVQQIALSYGEDIDDPDVRAQCIAVFGLGGPLTDDDSADTALWAGRIALSHQTVSGVIGTVVPRMARTMGESIAARAAPLVGAVAGAAINSSFTRYYQKMAHVHFRLRRLERRYPHDEVMACFERIVMLERERRKAHRRRGLR